MIAIITNSKAIRTRSTIEIQGGLSTDMEINAHCTSVDSQYQYTIRQNYYNAGMQKRPHDKLIADL